MCQIDIIHKLFRVKIKELKTDKKYLAWWENTDKSTLDPDIIKSVNTYFHINKVKSYKNINEDLKLRCSFIDLCNRLDIVNKQFQRLQQMFPQKVPES